MKAPYAPKQIAVFLDADFDFGMQILRGVQHYAQHEQNWRLLPLNIMQEDLFYSFLRRGLLSGVIGALISDRWLAGLPGKPVPTVNITDTSEFHAVSSVISDNRCVGRLAARHLLQQGYRTLGVLHEKASFAATQRYQGFIETAHEAGCAVATPPPSDSYVLDVKWPDWLASLLRPCGLFCSSDYLARRLLRHLRALPADVPHDFGVVGVGNCPLDNLLAHVPLTSIQLDGAMIGTKAAEHLAELLVHHELPTKMIVVSPARLVPRASTAKGVQGDPLVTRALILQDLAHPISGAKLAKQCGASKRTLEMRFKKVMGCGPAAALRKRRLEHAELLVRETQLSLVSIAETTGFAHASHFSCAFRKQYGLPPCAWRKKHS